MHRNANFIHPRKYNRDNRRTGHSDSIENFKFEHSLFVRIFCYALCIPKDGICSMNYVVLFF
jgi:hypothetical protein